MNELWVPECLGVLLRSYWMWLTVGGTHCRYIETEVSGAWSGVAV